MFLRFILPKILLKYFSLPKEIVLLIREIYSSFDCTASRHNFQHIEIMVISNNHRDRDQFSEKTLPCEGETITHLRLCSRHSLRTGISLPVKSVKARHKLSSNYWFLPTLTNRYLIIGPAVADCLFSLLLSLLYLYLLKEIYSISSLSP